MTEVEISDVTEPMSPNTKLRNKMKAKQQRIRTMNIHDNGSEVKKEMAQYEIFSLAPKEVNILHWWRDHERVLPLLSQIAKKVLTIPASSSKSERIFSTGGNFVTKKRNKLAPKKLRI